MAALLAGLITSTAAGHPLGARTFDRAIQVIIEPAGLRIQYELTVSDLTVTLELPRLGETAPIDPRAAAELFKTRVAPILATGLDVTLAGSTAEATLTSSRVELADHVTVIAHFYVPGPPVGSVATLSLVDLNFEQERGYHRVACRAAEGATLIASSAPADVLAMPLIPTWELTPEEEAARGRLDATYRLDVAPGREPAPDLADARVQSESSSSNRDATALRDLLANNQGSGASLGWLILAAAFGLGMLHALKPGHGKTLVAAYLVGSRGTVGQAIALGIVTTLTHTGSVLFVALLLRPLAGSAWIEQGQLSFWLTLVSGLLVFTMGASLLWRRLTGQEDLLHVHGPGGHVHLPDGSVKWLGGPSARGSHSLTDVLAMGVSGGLIPCDDAVLVLVAAIGAGLLPQAIFILFAFSAGLAGVLVAIGILVVKLRSFAVKEESAGLARSWVRGAEVVSAGLIAAIGLWLSIRAFGVG